MTKVANFEREYRQQHFAFPEISFVDFEKIEDLKIRKDIAKKNKIVSTDTYNRTMNFLKGDEKKGEFEVYTMTLRKSPNGFYNVVYGIKKIVDDILSLPISQIELDFARDFYANQKNAGGNSYFDKAMWQKIIDENNGFLPLTIKAVEDGTLMKPGEPIMSITGPAELAAVYEPLFLRVFYQTIVATDIHEIVNFLGTGRIVEFGKRAAINEEAHIDAIEALYVGGGLKFTSNDTAVLALSKVLSAGTTAHRYLASYENEDEAFENAVAKMDRVSLLVDLVDSIRGIDKIIELKKKYRFK
ncbi:MAG: nicotinamide phosphoribosyltransferase domain-containing protein, partial [Candidatus Gracilibacteria bacterium]|nr:nicotinamide phosphoribosyltransferase domain-containing protein [Candidatus Gracilibacteria bacterium]